jgi:asparagine synthase (glutamine-hydrolysing)
MRAEVYACDLGAGASEAHEVCSESHPDLEHTLTPRSLEVGEALDERLKLVPTALHLREVLGRALGSVRVARPARSGVPERSDSPLRLRKACCRHLRGNLPSPLVARVHAVCGIAGLVQPGRLADRALVERMTQTLVHRGPDDEGIHVDAEVGLGLRRLAIIDLETGNQPVSNESGSVHVVFNGEIYNFRELRHTLESAGHRFRSRGDAEVLPHLYEERGAEMVQDLRGMFAFALWDGERRELLLARDRVGEKPLYYSERLPGGGIAFASEMKALLAAGLSRDPDSRALVEYLYYLYIPAPRSGFAAIQKLPPGHLLRYRDGRTVISQYWQPRFLPVARTEREHIDGLRERVIDAVRARLVADVPIGAFLSGGIDSSSIVAAMCTAADGPVHTFTISFEGFEHYDESDDARLAARHFGTHHPELRAEAGGGAMLPEVVDAFDEPFGNATAVLVGLLSAATREHVKVALTGDGGDELFFGYPRYRGLQFAERYRAAPIGPLRRLAAAASKAIPDGTSGSHGLRRAREFLEAGQLSAAEAYARWIGYFTPELLDDLLKPELSVEARTVTSFLEALFRGGNNLDLNDVSRVELQSFLPYNVLEYGDKMSMAHSLELRAPFVDHHLVDYVGTLPIDVKFRNGTSKWALRQAFEQDLPPGVTRRRKRGLNPPLGAWLAGEAAPLVREFLSPDAVRRRGLLRPEAVASLLRDQRRGRRDRSLHIWALLVLELWFQRRVDA